MWAQLIQMNLKPGKDTTEMIKEIRAAEQAGSGLVRSMVLRDQIGRHSDLHAGGVRERGAGTRPRAGSAPRREARGRPVDHGRRPRRTSRVHRPGGRRGVDRGRRLPDGGLSMSEHPNAAIVLSAYKAVEQGDLAGFAGTLDDDILWHESMPGFEGDYRGRDEALALLGRIFEQTGMELNDISIHHVLADDSHAAVHLETTGTIDGRRHTSQYVDFYRLARRKGDRALASPRRSEGRRGVLRRLRPWHHRTMTTNAGCGQSRPNWRRCSTSSRTPTSTDRVCAPGGACEMSRHTGPRSHDSCAVDDGLIAKHGFNVPRGSRRALLRTDRRIRRPRFAPPGMEWSTSGRCGASPS